jgi:tRNA-modifying protein YgfZ
MGDVVTIEGPDAASYLQGQLSQDIAAIPVGGEAWSFVLEPNGHIDALVRVERSGDDAFALHADSGLGSAVEARLRKFLLRTQATIALTQGPADDAAARVTQARPGAPEFDERAVPAETGWVEQAVSFTKGCYTGQELVARMDSRVAEPPRRLVRLTLNGSAEPGVLIVVDGVAVGAITSVAGAAALGYVKRGTRLEGDARVGDLDATIEGPAGA